MAEMQDLLATIPQTGRVEWIGLSPGREQPIEVVESAAVEVGTGLVGDHHAAGGNSRRQVTLIQAEHLPVIAALSDREAVDAGDLRRNLVVSGINLLSLKKRRFQVGDVVLEGTGPCAPCSRMEQTVGSGGYQALRGHGGITTVVVSGGTIRIGDEVTALPS